jgi:hypothetical protein
MERGKPRKQSSLPSKSLSSTAVLYMCYYYLKYLGKAFPPDDSMLPPFTSRSSPDPEILQIFFSHWKSSLLKHTSSQSDCLGLAIPSLFHVKLYNRLLFLLHVLYFSSFSFYHVSESANESPKFVDLFLKNQFFLCICCFI